MYGSEGVNNDVEINVHLLNTDPQISHNMHVFIILQIMSVFSSLKVWSTVKIRKTRVLQNAIVPVGRPRPYSIIILNMRFLPKASLRASSQITASSYILEQHLRVKNAKPLALALTLYYCGDVETARPLACIVNQ